MADSTLNKLIHVIAENGAPALRQAAIKVSGVVGSVKERGLVKALLAALTDSDANLRIDAIQALGQLQVEEALPRLAEIIRHGGAEAEAAAHAASQLGAKGARVLGKIMHEAAPGLRSRLTGVLAKSGAGGALVVTAHALLDADPKVVDSAARSLAMEVPSFTPPQRHALAKFLIEELHNKKAKHSPKTEAGLLRVLSVLHDSKAEEIFWARIAPPAPPEARAAALQALGNLEAKPADKRLPKLLACAVDSDFQVVAAALMLLKQVPPGRKHAKHWLTLLEAPDVAARRFAVEKLQGVDSKEVAAGLADQASHPDRGLRDDAMNTLRGFAAGRQALLDKLFATVSHDDCWTIARSIAPAARELAKPQRARIFAEACRHHDAGDRLANPLWFLLREIDHDGLRDQIEAKALALRQKKKYAEALSFLRLLTQDPACSEDIRFELAATGLKLSNHDLSVDARNNEPSLQQFSRLLQNPAFDLTGRIAKAKWLDADDLFYLGFHFAEQTHRPREFGKEVLERVIERSPKSEIAKQAKRKLKSEALI
ncbi:MAG: HEAT repeat domain-containing protein [Gemmataceae bacterium]|nr:HEAT repeat domain-containing protein [Gemmataceae bacterium]